MKYLIDTDIVAGYLKPRYEDTVLLNALVADGLAISIITYGEIYDGIYFGRDPVASEQIFRQFLKSVYVLPLNRRIMQQFAQIRCSLRKTGNIISDNDILIGSTALYHNLTLVTRNTRDFQRIPNLLLYSI